MRQAQAVLTLKQLGLLLSGKAIAIRLPERLPQGDSAPPSWTTTEPVEICLTAEIPEGETVVLYTGKITTSKLTAFDRLFDHFDHLWADLDKKFNSLLSRL